VISAKATGAGHDPALFLLSVLGMLPGAGIMPKQQRIKTETAQNQRREVGREWGEHSHILKMKKMGYAAFTM